MNPVKTRLALAFLLYITLNQSGWSAVIEHGNCFDGLYSDCATGVTGLSVGSKTYDIVFIGDSLDDIQQVYGLPFLGDQSAAESATSALLALLNTSTVDGIRFDQELGVASATFWVPYNLNIDYLSAQNSSITAGGWNSPSVFLNTDSTTAGPWAVFVPVPIPAAAWFFVSALSLLTISSGKVICKTSYARNLKN